MRLQLDSFDTADVNRIIGFEMSDEQLAAVTADLTTPLLVVAGAGSGKTTVMAARVLWAVATGQVDPDKVVGLTFTRKAAGELGSRIRDLLAKLAREFAPGMLNDVDWGTPQVSTYHSFAHHFVAEHGLRIGVEPGAQLLAQADALQIAHRVLINTRRPLSGMAASPATLADVLVSLDQQLAEHICSIDSLRSQSEAVIEAVDRSLKTVADDRTMQDVARRRLLLCPVIDEYRAEKQRLGVVDFADIMRLGRELAVRDDVQVLAHAAIDMILLDEYQDTSVVQAELLAPLVGPGKSITAVGDPLQAIYGWRGAGAGAMDSFAHHFGQPRGKSGQAQDSAPGARDGGGPSGESAAEAGRSIAVLQLSTSHRCGVNVLAVANEVAAPLRDEVAHVVTLRPGERGDGHVPVDGVRLALLETHAEETRHLGAQLVEQLEAGVEPADIAVLCRARADFAPVLAELQRRGIPAVVSSSEGLIAQPEVADILSLLRVVVDPTDNPAMIRVLTGPRYRIGPRDLAVLGKFATRLLREGTDARGRSTGPAKVSVGKTNGGRADSSAVDFTESIRGIDPIDVVSLAEAVDALAEGDGAEFSEQARDRLGRLAAELRDLRSASVLPLADFLSRVIAVTGLDVEARLNAIALAGSDVSIAHRGLTAINALYDLARQAQEANGVTAAAEFVAWLDVLEQVGHSPEFDLPTPQDAVTILTVHRAKGLEWDVVAVPFMSSGVFPTSRSRSKWTSTLRELPHPLRGDRDALPMINGLGTKSHGEFVAELSQMQASEERRLAYVAVTRARRLLLLSGHWWGPTQTKPRGPSDYLLQARATMADPSAIEPWIEESRHRANPALVADEPVSWPPELDSLKRSRRLEAAKAVVDLIDVIEPASADSVRAALEVAPANLSAVDAQLVAQWDEDIELLLSERSLRRTAEGLVRRRTYSASDVMAIGKDPEGFAAQQVRPLPQPPSKAAIRGTRVHTWVEQYFETPAVFDDLPGIVDEEPVDAADLEHFKEGFRRTPYAEMVPFAIEAPFSVVIDGIELKGRIDAVFLNGDQWEVVDWKTNQSQSADPTQLAVYRHAWSRMMGVDPATVTGVFVYLKTGDVLKFDDLPDINAVIEPLQKT